MQRIHSAISPVLASICLVIFTFSAHAQETVPLQTGALGKIGSIAYMDGNLKPQKLDVTKGKLTALHFWATWCVPCVDELPQVDDEQEIFGKDLQIVPISLDGKNIDKVKKFYKDHKIEHLPALIDPTATTAKAAGLKGLPGTVFIDPKGNIVARADGPLDWQQADVAKFIKSRLK